MEASGMRHEIKHLIHRVDWMTLRSRLRPLAQPDPYAVADGQYTVRSLYLDNYRDKALLEKLDGVNRREKFRVRCYNGDYSFLRLEKKRKENGLCQKSSVEVGRKYVEALLLGQIPKPDRDHPLLWELYIKQKEQQLMPRTLVDYTREAYLYRPGNVRITVDSGVRTGVYCRNFFDSHAPTLPAGDPDTVVLEVKYDAFLPDLIRDLLQIPDRRWTAFSKYAAARVFG